MAAALFGAAWLLVGVGLALSRRASTAPWEQVLVVAFWPFFLAAHLTDGPPTPAAGPAPASSSPPEPLRRLRAALAPDDPAQATVADLGAVLARKAERVARLDLAVAAAAVDLETPSSDDPLVAARRRSRALLAAARDRERRSLAEGLAAVEDAATRLTLLRECGEGEDVGALIADLAARLGAAEEVAGEGSA